MHKGEKVGQEYVFGKNGFPMDVSTWQQHGDYPRHTHDFSEIAIILQGTGTMEVDDQAFRFHAGDVFVLHGNRPHAYVDTHDLTLINITYLPQLVALDRFDSGVLPGYQALFVIEPTLRHRKPYERHLTLNADQMIKTKSLTDIMEKELHEKEPGYQLMAVGHFMVLISQISRFYTESEAPDAQKLLQLANVLSFLEQHCMEEIDMDELIRIAHMSRRSFYRAFSEVTLQTPRAYLLNLRVMKAVELLETTKKNITEIAFACGFQDSNYFSRQFKKVMNTTPSEFQKRFNWMK